MKIVCPTCTSQYDLPDGSIGPEGRKVRCTECKTVWLAAAEVDNVTRAPAMPSAWQEPTPRIEQPDATAAASEPIAPEPPPAPAPALVDEKSVELDAWIAIASEQNGSTPGANDQDSVDSLFDDAPSVPVFDEASLPEPDNDTSDPEKPGETAAPLRAPVVRQRGMLNNPIGKFRTRKSRAAPAIAAGVALLLAAVMGSIAYRDAVVGVVPQLAGVYKAIGIPVNLRGLEIASISSQLTEADGVPVLVINGQISNPVSDMRALPPLFFAVLDDNGKQKYGWSVSLSEKTIEPGATISFRRRLAAPPPEARKVMVRFFKDGDPAPAASGTDAPAQEAAGDGGKSPPKEHLP